MTSNQPKLDGSIVGELLLGELPDWTVGVCSVIPSDDGRALYVYGEDGSELAYVESEDHIHAPNGVPLVDLDGMADSVNFIVGLEHSRL